MESTFSKAEDLAAHIKEYVNNRMASVKFSIAERSSKILAGIVAVMVLVMVFIMSILFASIAAAYFLSKITGELYWGFLIVAGIYLLLGMLVWIAKEKILRLPIMNVLLQQLFGEDTEEDEKN